MPSRRLEITLSEGQWDRLDAARGFEPRASFVKRALESALACRDEGSPPVRPVAEKSAGPVSSRAPVEKGPATGVGSSGEDGRVSPADLPASSRQAKEYELPKIAPRRR